MSILTEKEREDVYKYWLHSSTLTNEDGLIQLAERAVLEKLAGMELPDIEATNLWDHMLAWHQAEPGNCEVHADKATTVINAQLLQAYAQGAASQLSAQPVACIVEASDGANMVWPIADLDEARTYCEDDEEPVLLYTLNTAK